MRYQTRKSIAIIGEGQTEYCYFDALRRALNYPLTLKPELPHHSSLDDIVEMAKRCIGKQFDYVICLVDMDRMQSAQEEKKYRKYKREMGSKVMWIETNPCTEFWFLLHFMQQPSVREYTSDEVVKELKKHLPEYAKKQEVLTKIHKLLTEKGDVERAKINAEVILQKHYEEPAIAMAYTEIHKIFRLLNHNKSIQ